MSQKIVSGICVIGLLSGWILEGAIFNSLWRDVPLPAFVLLLPPVVGFHFVLLVLHAVTEVRDDARAGRSAPVRWTVALACPLALASLLVLLTR